MNSHSHPAEFGRLAELLTNDVEHCADILADVRDLPLMLLKFCSCSIEQASSLVFQCVACDTTHLIQ